MKADPKGTIVLDALGAWGISLALFLGIPAVALHLAWARGEGTAAVLMGLLLIGTAWSGWRDFDRGHVGKLSATLTVASLVGLVSILLPAL